MWIYEKKLQYPVKIKNPNPKLAAAIISQLGGPDGELAASMRLKMRRFEMSSDFERVFPTFLQTKSGDFTLRLKKQHD